MDWTGDRPTARKRLVQLRVQYVRALGGMYSTSLVSV
jgi:hypothetical protein